MTVMINMLAPLGVTGTVIGTSGTHYTVGADHSLSVVVADVDDLCKLGYGLVRFEEQMLLAILNQTLGGSGSDASAAKQDIANSYLNTIVASVTGVLTVTQAGAWTVNLPSGAATETTLGGVLTAVQALSTAAVQGTVAPGAAATASVLMGGVYTAAGITLTNNQQAALQFTSDGRLRVGLSAAGPVAPGTAPSNTVLGGSIYTAAGITLTDGQAAARQTDSKGYALTNIVVGAPSKFRRVSAGSDDLASIKGSAGKIVKISAYNNSSAIGYLHLYDKASAPVLASDTPVETILIPHNSGAGAGVVEILASGDLYSIGIAMALTTTIAATTAPVASGAIVVNASYF